MINSEHEIVLVFDRFVEKQIDVDVFRKVWTEDVSESYTLEECKELISSDVVTFEQVLDASFEEDWSEAERVDWDENRFEKKLKTFFGIQ
jgi:hypothetical protein